MTDETADGHERALRSFGARFGNGLYGDQPPVSGSPRPKRAPAQAKLTGVCID